MQRKHPPYTVLRTGIFHFVQAVPSDVQAAISHCGRSERILHKALSMRRAHPSVSLRK